MTYNDITAWMIEANGHALGLTDSGVMWIPFTDESIFTMACETENEAEALMELARLSGAAGVWPPKVFVAEHSWYNGAL